MKATYPIKGCTTITKIVLICMMLWGICAGYQDPLQHNISFAEDIDATPAFIKTIEVVEQDDASAVTISASKPPTYTVVKLKDPLRIVIDIPEFKCSRISCL